VIDFGSRQPICQVRINGILVNFIDLEISSPSYYEADTFELTLAQKDFPPEMDVNFWDNNQAFLVEVYAGFLSNTTGNSTFELMLTAQVDNLEIEIERGIYLLTGRDLTAKFIDNKTSEKFQNLTSSQVATLLANRRGLTPNVTATSTPVGYFYNNDHVQLAVEKTEWDILVYLAQKENFLVFVTGTTLNFVPVPTEQTTPYLLTWVAPNALNGSPFANVKSLKLQKSMTLAKDIIVEVRSWNQQEKKGFTVKVKGVPNQKTFISSKAQPIGDAQVNSFEIGGLTKEQALQYAQQKLRELSRFQRLIEAEAVGDNALKKDSIIKLTGTGTDYDQFYYPSRVTRKWNLEDGYEMTIEAKNSSPISTVIL
jgi:phage protein D